MTDKPKEQTKDNQTQFDSRIVKTVRNLKGNSSKNGNSINNLNNSLEKTAGDSPKEQVHEKNKSVTSLKINKQVQSPQLIKSNSRKQNRISIESNEKNHISQENNENQSLNHPKEIVTKISINAKSKPKPKFSNSNLYSTQFTSTGFRKTKSKYIQNLMSDTSIKKYKQTFLSILKSDSEIVKLYEECGFEKTNYSYENFIEKNFFSQQIFLYRLEMLLTNNEMNFVKKNYKEKFFRDEIIKFMKHILFEDRYRGKIENLTKGFEKHFNFISSFDFNK